MSQRVARPPQVLLGQLSTRLVEQLLERGALGLKAALEGAVAGVQRIGDVLAARRGVRQALREQQPHPMTRRRAFDVFELFLDQARVQCRHVGIARRQPQMQIGLAQQGAVRRAAEVDRAAEDREVPRCVDLPFVFGNFGPSLFSNIANSTANKPGRLDLSDAMMKSMGAFARSGDPNNAALGVVWPAWPSKLIFDATPTSKSISVQ